MTLRAQGRIRTSVPPPIHVRPPWQWSARHGRATPEVGCSTAELPEHCFAWAGEDSNLRPFRGVTRRSLASADRARAISLSCRLQLHSSVLSLWTTGPGARLSGLSADPIRTGASGLVCPAWTFASSSVPRVRDRWCPGSGFVTPPVAASDRPPTVDHPCAFSSGYAATSSVGGGSPAIWVCPARGFAQKPQRARGRIRTCMHLPHSGVLRLPWAGALPVSYACNLCRSSGGAASLTHASARVRPDSGTSSGTTALVSVDRRHPLLRSSPAPNLPRTGPIFPLRPIPVYGDRAFRLVVNERC